MAITEFNFSKFSLSIAAILIFLAGAAIITAYPRQYPVEQEDIESFVADKISEWETKYADEEGLKVARVDIHFKPYPLNFAKNEGAVISSAGADLPGFQKIIETAAYPPQIRKLPVDGITALAWPYTGKCRSHYRYVSLSLVRQEFIQPTVNTESPSFTNLPEAFLADALATAKDLEEHNLQQCSDFPEWAKKTAGEGTYLEQFKRIAQTVSADINIESDDKRRTDNVCTAIRHSRFSSASAHVAAVMACRELRIPCFAFTAAVKQENHIIGTFSNSTGWIFFDLDKPEKGFFTNPPVLLTMAPIISRFQGSRNNYWYPEAAAYRSFGNNNISSFSYTKWGDKNEDSDITLAQTFNLKGNKSEKQ